MRANADKLSSNWIQLWTNQLIVSWEGIQCRDQNSASAEFRCLTAAFSNLLWFSNAFEDFSHLAGIVSSGSIEKLWTGDYSEQYFILWFPLSSERIVELIRPMSSHLDFCKVLGCEKLFSSRESNCKASITYDWSTASRTWISNSSLSANFA